MGIDGFYLLPGTIMKQYRWPLLPLLPRHFHPTYITFILAVICIVFVHLCKSCCPLIAKHVTTMACLLHLYKKGCMPGSVMQLFSPLFSFSVFLHRTLSHSYSFVTSIFFLLCFLLQSGNFLHSILSFHTLIFFPVKRKLLLFITAAEDLITVTSD